MRIFRVETTDNAGYHGNCYCCGFDVVDENLAIDSCTLLGSHNFWQRDFQGTFDRKLLIHNHNPTMSSLKNTCNTGKSGGGSSDIPRLDILEFGKEIEEKIKEMAESAQNKALDVEASKAPSPVSVADQMVSMLWASASSPAKKSMNGRCSPKEVVDESNHGYFREERECYEDIEEITIQDDSEGNDTSSGNHLFDEIIEEITVEDNNESDIDIVLDIDDEYSGSKAFIEVEISHNIEEHDDHSFDEITADDSEYDEKTIEESLHEDREKSNDGSQLPSKVGTPNPRSTRSPSVGAKFAEKLKMFDSPTSFPPRGSPRISDQSYNRPAARTFSAQTSFEDSKMNTKVVDGSVLETSESNPHFEPRSKNMNQTDETLQKDSIEEKTDEALVDEIVSLVKKPGAMKNKNELAERITYLLRAESKIPSKMSMIKATERTETQVPTVNVSEDATSSKPVKSLISQSKFPRRTSLHLNESKEKNSIPGLDEMRKNTEMHHENLKNVMDLDLAGNGTSEHPGTGDSKQEAIEKQKVNPLSEVGKKAVNPEEIMARIWSKPRTRHKSTPTSHSVASGSSESTAAETQKITTPRKLGDKLKMFESPTSSGPSKKIDRGPRLDATNTMLNIDQETIRRISTFQRLWKLKNSGRTTECVSKTETILTVSADRKSSRDPEKTFKSIHPSINSFNGTGQDSNLGAEATPDRDSKIPHSNGSKYYSLEDLEKGNFDRSIVDMERWEEFLTDENFYEQFGTTKTDFFGQPKWKRDKQKRRIRVAF